MQKKKKTIITLAILVVLAIVALFLIKSCNKEEPHVHTYKINDEGTWICKEDGDILANTDEPYVAILEDEQPKEITPVDNLPSTKINFGNGFIYKEDNAIYYSGDKAQTVIIKTEKSKINDIYDHVVINAPNDNIYHYGASTVICLDAVATTSHYEYGEVDLMTLTKARIVLENPSNVKEIYLDINGNNYKYETSIIALKEDAQLPRLTRDVVELQEGEVKTLAIIENLKDEVKEETNNETKEVIETIETVKVTDDSYVKIENVRKSNDELIIEAFLSPNSDENDKTQTTNQTTSTVTLEEAKEGSSHPASKNTFKPKNELVTETIEPNKKQEEPKEVIYYTPVVKKEEVIVVEYEPSTPAHKHSYGDWYLLDSDYHARVCSCGNIDKQLHTDSNSDNKCDICGYVCGTSIWNKTQDVFYDTFAYAFGSYGIADGDTIAILKDLEISSVITVDKNVIIDGNDKTITNLNESPSLGNYGITINSNKKVGIIGGTFSNCNFKNSNSQIIIRGGTFDFDPTNYVSSAYRDNHYRIINNNNNTYTVSDQEIFIYNSNNILVDRLSLGEFRDNVNTNDYELYDNYYNIYHTYVGYCVKVMKNCDYTDNNWTPIGYRTYGKNLYEFDGIFDGNGKTIKVKNDNITCCDYFGFFGEVCNYDTENIYRIFDLNLEVNFKASANKMPYNVVGGLVSETYAKVGIKNVNISGTIVSNRVAGGIVGNVLNDGTNLGKVVIDNCNVNADISAFGNIANDNWVCVGGLVGQNNAYDILDIKNCKYKGVISSSFTGVYLKDDATSYLGYAFAKGANDGGSKALDIANISNFTVEEGSSISGYYGPNGKHDCPFEGLNLYNNPNNNTYDDTANHDKELVGGYFQICTIDGATTGTNNTQSHYPHG